MAGRKINPRREVMAIVIEAKRLAARLGNAWQVPSRNVWDGDLYRARRPDEMTENRYEAWRHLIDEARLMRDHAAQLERIAIANYRHTHSPARFARCGCYRVALNAAPAIEHHESTCLDGRSGWEMIK